MAARYVVDTNVLVYALDRREPEKRERAREGLRRVGAGAAALPARMQIPGRNPASLRRAYAVLLAGVYDGF